MKFKFQMVVELPCRTSFSVEAKNEAEAESKAWEIWEQGEIWGAWGRVTKLDWKIDSPEDYQPEYSSLSMKKSYDDDWELLTD